MGRKKCRMIKSNDGANADYSCDKKHFCVCEQSLAIGMVMEFSGGPSR